MTAAPPVQGMVTIDDGPLSLADLCAVARGAHLQLGPAARARIADARAVVDEAVDGPDLIYGLNTGLGHMRDVRVDRGTLGLYQEVIVRSHVGAIGRPLPTDVVRAAIAVRINGFARGGSGISPAVADGLVAMLEAGIHPVIGETGSVGAADLMHMAAIAQVLIGAGRAELRGEILDGAEALRRAGLAPVRLGPKDGLALISANGVSIGRGALVIDRATRLARAVDVVFALSLESVRGNPSIVEPIVARSKPVPGQREAATRIRRFLTGSGRCEPGGATSVQDPLSFRVAPQVHGALRTFLTLARDAVELELNAADDNPVVDIDEGRLVSNGNFHPIAMALAFDALRPALAHVGVLADRRLDHHWRLVFAQEMTEELLLGLADSGALLRYAAAARTGDLRALAAPATLDIGSLDLGQEDHSTNAPTTVARTDAALDALADVLATEVLSARWLLRLNETIDLGVGTAAALGAVETVLAGLPETATTEDRHAAVRDQLDTTIVEAAEIDARVHDPTMTARPRPAAAGGLVLLAALASFTANLDLSIVNLALPVIGKAFGAGQAELAWVVNAYVLPYAVSILAVGRLGDGFGHRRVLAYGALLFALGSFVAAAAGVAGGYPALLLGRAMQGLGGSALLTIALAVVSANFSGEARGVALGRYFAAGAGAAVIGPLIGAVLASVFGWPGIFASQVPLGILVAVLAWRLLPDASRTRHVSLDVPALVAATIALAGINVALLQGEAWGWTSAAILGAWAVAAVALAAFVVRERTAAEPAVRLAIFRSRGFVASALVGAAAWFGILSGSIQLAIYLQVGRGLGALEAALVLVPWPLVAAFLFPRSAAIARRFGPDRTMTACLLVAVIAAALMIGLDASTPLPVVSLLAALGGAPIAVAVTASTLRALADFPPQEAGVASGVFNSLRQVGASLGVAIPAAVFELVAASSGPAAATSAAFASRAVVFGLVLVAVVGLLGTRPRATAAPAGVPAS